MSDTKKQKRPTNHCGSFPAITEAQAAALRYAMNVKFETFTPTA